MLNLKRINGGLLLFSDAARKRVGFPAEGEAKEMVSDICPDAKTEVTQQHPVSLVLRVLPELSDGDRARLLQRMDDYVSRAQLDAA